MCSAKVLNGSPSSLLEGEPNPSSDLVGGIVRAANAIIINFLGCPPTEIPQEGFRLPLKGGVGSPAARLMFMVSTVSQWWQSSLQVIGRA